MTPLAHQYCTVHRQGFIPIFVSDRFDAVMLVEAAVAAGAKAVEITCRRIHVVEEIRRVRRQFPDLTLLVGSVVDDGPMLHYLKRRRPEMPSLDELAELDVDGFVSFMPLSESTIERFSRTHLVIPGVETIPEAVTALETGAHFAKLHSIDALGGPARVAVATSAPAHGLLPIFVTGGVTRERIETFLDAGAALLAAGWDVLLGAAYDAQQDDPAPQYLTDALRRNLDTVAAARRKLNIELLDDNTAYLRSITHYHPFTV